jgi:hypothetical protein
MEAIQKQEKQQAKTVQFYQNLSLSVDLTE